MGTNSAAPAPGARRPGRPLDAAQRARLDHAARQAALLYPDDPELQLAALDAANQYLHGTANLADAVAEWDRIRREEQRVRAAVRQIALMTVADKTSERSVARALGVDRMTLRRWSGKTPPRARGQVSGLGRGEHR